MLKSYHQTSRISLRSRSAQVHLTCLFSKQQRTMNTIQVVESTLWHLECRLFAFIITFVALCIDGAHKCYKNIQIFESITRTLDMFDNSSENVTPCLTTSHCRHRVDVASRRGWFMTLQLKQNTSRNRVRYAICLSSLAFVRHPRTELLVHAHTSCCPSLSVALLDPFVLLFAPRPI